LVEAAEDEDDDECAGLGRLTIGSSFMCCSGTEESGDDIRDRLGETELRLACVRKAVGTDGSLRDRLGR
jgi:hypothetical protein